MVWNLNIMINSRTRDVSSSRPTGFLVPNDYYKYILPKGAGRSVCPSWLVKREGSLQSVEQIVLRGVERTSSFVKGTT